MNNLLKIPLKCAVFIISVLLGYLWVIFNLCFLRHLIQKEWISGILLALIFNFVFFVAVWSYIMAIKTPSYLDYQPFLDENQITQVKKYTKKSNAITSTIRLRQNNFLVDTSNINRNQLAYADDVADIFQPQPVNQYANQGQMNSNNQKEQNKNGISDEPGQTNLNSNLPDEERPQQNQPDYGTTDQTNQVLFTEDELAHFDYIKDIQQIKYCFKCDALKPPRTHHCKVCQKCILKMDHHCPWIGNCVGEKNQKYFVMFLIYTSTAILLVSLSVFVDSFFFNGTTLSTMGKVEHHSVILVASGGLPFFISVAFLGGYQMYLVANNYTTIESRIPQMSSSLNPFRYDLKKDNFKAVFGDRIEQWLFPIQNI